MRVAASDDHRIGLAGQVKVVSVSALAAYQHRVFIARQRLADAEFGQGKLVNFNTTVHRRTSTR
jgi:hypothetical protein